MNRSVLALSMLALLTVGQTAAGSAVSEPGKSPYFTTMDEAVSASAGNKTIVLKFFTDW